MHQISAAIFYSLSGLPAATGLIQSSAFFKHFASASAKGQASDSGFLAL